MVNEIQIGMNVMKEFHSFSFTIKFGWNDDDDDDDAHFTK